MKSLLQTGIAALALIAAVTAPAFAQNTDGSVDVGGVHILTVRFPAGGLSVKERADAVTDRLVTILSNPRLRPSDIVATPFGKQEAQITVAGQLLITVDARTAQYNTSTAMTLAQIWVGHLRHVLPQVNVQPNPNDRQ
jgi:hypothetical protein